jgi:Tol biopolymer transport system component
VGEPQAGESDEVRVAGRDRRLSLVPRFTCGVIAGLAVLLTVSTCKDASAPSGPAQFDIYVMNANGQIAFASDRVASGAQRLTDHLAFDFWPTWSPDGSRIAFTSDRGDITPRNLDIYVMNADGTGVAQVTADTAWDDEAAWGQGLNSGRLAFRTNRDGNDEIYLVNVDGSGPVRLTNDPGHDIYPAWHPDGSKIAFVTDRDGNPEIYVMNADGTGLVNLSQHAAFDLGPSWSPDGTKIAFHSNRDGSFAIYVMNADGSGTQRLTDSGTPDELPSWSPDGSRIAFDSDAEIYVMQSNGMGLTRVTSSDAQDFAPRWRP